MAIDLGLDDSGDLPLFARTISGAELVAQRIRVRLGTHRGEDPRDSSRGLPWVDWLQQRPPQVDSIVAAVRREVLATDGVVRVLNWTGSFSRTTGVITISGEAVVSSGRVIDVGVSSALDSAVNPYPAAVTAVRPIVVAP